MVEEGGAPTRVVVDDDSLASMGSFLTEHHNYLATSTMAQIATMQKTLVQAFTAEREASEVKHREELMASREETASARAQLGMLQHSYTKMMGEQESISWTSASRHLKGKKALNKQNVFLSWVRIAASQKSERLLMHVAAALHVRNNKSRILTAWHRYVHGSHSARAKARAEQKLKEVTAEIVGRYEEELVAMRSRITLLQDEVVDGRRRRKVLEDELRRTLLKGMVTMNMEALSIFSSAAATDATIARDVGVSLLYDAEPVPRASAPSPALHP